MITRAPFDLRRLAKPRMPLGGALQRGLGALDAVVRAGRLGGLGVPPGSGTTAGGNGVAPQMRDLLDRFAALKPGVGLCGMAPLAGAAVTVAVPDGARFEDLTFRDGASALGYRLYVPRAYRGEPSPLVVMLHGCTQSPEDFAAGTRMNEVVEERGVLVAYPRQPASANPQKCWNWFEAGDQQRGRGEPALIAGLTRDVMRDFAVDPARVYVAGLSAGGAAAAIMAQAYPDLYAAAGIHSGLAVGAAHDVPSAMAAMRQGAAPQAGGRPGGDGRGGLVPVIVFHGDHDRTVHPTNGEQVLAQARGRATLDSAATRGEAPGGLAFTRTVGTDARGVAMVEHWLLHGAGHAWSGGSRAGSYTEPRGPDASREMLRFFLSHAKAARFA